MKANPRHNSHIYNNSINVLSMCSNIISHRSSKVDTSIIDLRRSTHRSPRSTHRSSKVNTSIFEGQHIDLRRSKAETSHRQFVTEYCPQRHSIVLYPKILYGIISNEGTHTHTILYCNSNVRDPTRALVMYCMPIYIAYMH